MAWWNPFAQVNAALAQIVANQATTFSYLRSLEKRMNAMASQLDDLTKQVAQNTSVEQSAVTLIQGIAAQLAAAGTDPAKLQALTQQLNASATALAAAVAANTPTPPPAPSP